MMEVNIWAVLAATVAQFAVAAFWYTALFGKKWGEMFEFDKLPKKKQKEMQQKMGPYYLVQALVTFLTSYVLAHFIGAFGDVAFWQIAFLTWLGFAMPTQVSAVIFGGVEPKWIPTRIGIMAGGSLVSLMAGAWVISLIM